MTFVHRDYVEVIDVGVGRIVRIRENAANVRMYVIRMFNPIPELDGRLNSEGYFVALENEIRLIAELKPWKVLNTSFGEVELLGYPFPDEINGRQVDKIMVRMIPGDPTTLREVLVDNLIDAVRRVM